MSDIVDSEIMITDSEQELLLVIEYLLYLLRFCK